MAVFWDRYCSSCTPQRFFSILENKLIGFADDTVSGRGARVSVCAGHINQLQHCRFVLALNAWKTLTQQL